jgi:hypothetical protein
VISEVEKINYDKTIIFLCVLHVELNKLLFLLPDLAHPIKGKAKKGDGAVAQSVEQRTENPCVGGSIPPHTTTKPLIKSEAFFIYMLRYILCSLKPGKTPLFRWQLLHLLWD